MPVLYTFVGACNWIFVEAFLLISTYLPCICAQESVGTNPAHFLCSSLAIWTLLFSEAFERCSSLSQTNMTTDVLGSGPFEQPFNKTSSAVRHTGSFMLGSPAENTFPPVSKPSSFGSPRRASIILRGLFKLAAKVLPFFIQWAMWHLGEIHHIWNRFYLGYRSRYRDYTVGANILWQRNSGRFLMWCWVGHTHLPVTRARDDGCSDAPEACCVCQTFNTLPVTVNWKVSREEGEGRKEKYKWGEMTEASFTAWYPSLWHAFVDLFSFSYLPTL